MKQQICRCAHKQRWFQITCALSFTCTPPPSWACSQAHWRWLPDERRDCGALNARQRDQRAVAACDALTFVALELDIVKETVFHMLMQSRRCHRSRLINDFANDLLFAIGQRFDLRRQRPARPLQLHRALQLHGLHAGQLRSVPPARRTSQITSPLHPPMRV